MVAVNAADGSTSKVITFVLCFTSDGLQDSHAKCAPSSWCTQTLLPDGVTHVRFRCDGAGCFASELCRCAQPHWERWAGVVESCIACRRPAPVRASSTGCLGG